MKIKGIFASIAFLVIVFSSCSKDCNDKSATCSETAPTNEACQAYFERWFYSKSSNKCELVQYSGCSSKGFATQQECEACKCDK